MKRLLFTLALVGALSSCAGFFTVVTDPSAFSVPGKTSSPRAGQAIALLNGYDRETMKPVGDHVQFDYQQVTDTALGIMKRHLEKNGVSVTSAAPRKVTLKVVNARMYFMNIPFAERWRTNLDLEATFDDGTSASVHAENSASMAMGFRGNVAPQRSVEGAAMFAVTDLLNDRRFLSYANR